MDSLDKLTRSDADREALSDADISPSSLETLADTDVRQDIEDKYNDFKDRVEGAVDEAADVVSEVAPRGFGRWTMIAAGAVVAAAAVGGYAYWRSQQQKPKTRFERFKDRLGLSHLDMTSVPSAVRSVDYDQLNRTGRDLGRFAKKKVHVGARKVAELTR